MANVNLSQRDIDYIARVVDTEVPRSIAKRNPDEYKKMVDAVVDTVTNRMASGSYPASATGVLNQSRQFSKITGPANLDPYGSVQATPRAPEDVRNMVSDRIAGAAAGEPSLIGGALNYANPNFSSPSNLSGWINPMIDAGAEMFGVGKNVHYHGTAPGQQPVGAYSLSAEGIPNGNVPSPSFRDAPTQSQAAYGLMSAIDPATPSPVERGGLLADPRSMPSLSYPSSAPSGLLGSPQTASFDMGRFGPAPTQPSTPAPQESVFDVGRFGDLATPALADPSMNGLRRGLLDQQLAMGELPSLANPAYSALNAPVDPTLTAATPATPGYIDPMVTTQAQPTAPTTAARVEAPTVTRAASALSPEQQALQNAGGVLQTQATPGLDALVNKEMGQRKLGGGLLGGLAGGLLLGPVGAVLGGLLGKNVAQKTYYPPAPEPIDPKVAAKVAKNGLLGGNGGFGGLSDYGRSVAGSSGQFHDAVASGKSGLW